METPNPSGENEKAPVESNDLDGNNVDMQINNEMNKPSTVLETEAGNTKLEEKPDSIENTSDKMDTSIENKIPEPMDIDLTLDDEETAESTNKNENNITSKDENAKSTKDTDTNEKSNNSKEEDSEKKEENGEKNGENKKNSNVIDLDDSDSDSGLTIIPPIPRKKTSCINPDCLGYNENLMKVTGYCLSFYKVKLNSKRTQVICKDCRDEALNNFQVSCINVYSKIRLLTVISLVWRISID